ncbi:hypothetical protein G9P44_002238 [Scheffersomyces stipitis]|nr:hypothetical protein G9P44_002238 [Scheffersomyces stipitis]
MFCLTNDLFNRHIAQFHDLLVKHLQFVGNEHFAIKITNNFQRTFPPNQSKTLSYISLSVVDLKDIIVVNITFTVSFSDIYEVPVVHFRVSDETGSLTFDLDKLDSYIKLIGKDYTKDKVDLLLVNHPLLNETWWSIHPCYGQEVVAQFLENTVEPSDSEGAKSIKYMSTWFGVYGIGAVFDSLSFRLVTVTI